MTQKQFTLNPLVDVAIRKAAEYARYLGSSSVDTEHLLLGFLQFGDNLFRQAPNATIRAELLARIQRSTPIEPSQELSFSDSTARTLGILHVGNPEAALRVLEPEHVLLAVLDEHGVAADVLHSFGIHSREDLNVRFRVKGRE